MNCPYCDNPVPQNVNNCPSCGAQVDMQQQTTSPQVQPDNNTPASGLWMSITSLALGILAFITAWSDFLDEDELTGMLMFIIASAILGVIAITNKKPGKRMAITGIILSALAFIEWFL